MHIVIATVGTRGDAQPYVAVGKALAARGHRVSLATHEDHRELAESHGLELRPACGSFRELMASDAGRAWLESGDSVGKYLETFRALFSPIAKSWMHELEAAMAGADAVLVHGIAAGAIIPLQRLGIPYVVVSPYSVVPSGEFDMGLPRIPFLNAWMNRAAHRFFVNQVWQLGKEEIDQYLADHGIPKPPVPMWQHQLDRGIGHLFLWSEHVATRPKDFPACVEMTGYCFLDALSSWKPSAALVDFVSAKPAPIYVGFGSMTGMDPEKLATLTKEALRRAKKRAVIAMGWGGISGFDGSDDVLVTDDVPHDWLFPRVAGIVHHCGAGTTAAALRAGRPSVGVPFFGDQPFWARLMTKLGVSPAPIPKKKLTSDRLADAIVRATTDAKMAEAAEALGARIRSEDGASRTAERALHHLEKFPAR